MEKAEDEIREEERKRLAAQQQVDKLQADMQQLSAVCDKLKQDLSHANDMIEAKDAQITKVQEVWKPTFRA